MVDGLSHADVAGNLLRRECNLLEIGLDGQVESEKDIVQDKKGNPVADLGPEDFVVIQDGERKLITKIEDALARLDEGTYGYCEETSEPISIRRLEARPIATLSLEAQERHERLEKTHRDD